VAVELATRVHPAGLILDGALTSVTERAQEAYPLVPVRWIARSRYASIERIGRLTRPLFLHARGRGDPFARPPSVQVAPP
jgi:hypothetical protein